MQQSINPVDELLEQWEEMKYCSSHITPTDDIDILDYMRRKGQLMAYSQELRYARCRIIQKLKQSIQQNL